LLKSYESGVTNGRSAASCKQPDKLCQLQAPVRVRHRSPAVPECQLQSPYPTSNNTGSTSSVYSARSMLLMATDSLSIKAATMINLIVRLTHHLYLHPKFSLTFLMFFGGFATPKELPEEHWFEEVHNRTDCAQQRSLNSSRGAD
jgi:hypothetical protein